MTHSDFIPSRESRLIITLFAWYSRLLARRRFKHIWLKQSYQPDKSSKTVYFLNHSSWWDGLIPLLLNNYLFQQQARAMMEDKQMHQYPFFSRIGAFSVNLDDTRNMAHSLRYAFESMQRANSSLFLYPEGKIVPFSTDQPEFRGGLAWLYNKMPDIDFVPVGIYIHTMRYDKPELHINIGEAVSHTGEQGSKVEIQDFLEKALQKLLNELQLNSGFNNSEYIHWM